MRTPGQRPGSRPGGEGTPPKVGPPAWASPPGPGEKIPRTVTASGALSRGACRLACSRRQTAPLRHGRSGIARHGLFFCLTAASAGMCVDQKKGRNDFYENATHLDHTGGAGRDDGAGHDHRRLAAADPTEEPGTTMIECPDCGTVRHLHDAATAWTENCEVVRRHHLSAPPAAGEGYVQSPSQLLQHPLRPCCPR